MENLTDEQLLAGVQKGDEIAFVALFRRRKDGIYRFSYALCGRSDWAEEITQEVFMALMNSARQLNADKGTVQAWLYSVARNQSRKRLEKEHRYVSWESENDLADGIGSQEDVLAALTNRERLEALEEAVQALPSPFREVLVLCDLEEAPYDVAAGLLECPLGTIRSRLSRARAMLAGKLRTHAACKG